MKQSLSQILRRSGRGLSAAGIAIGSGFKRTAPHFRKWWALYLVPLLLVCWLVWPTPYTYRKDNGGFIRINRLTQGVGFLYGGEWLSAQEVAKKEQERKEKEADASLREAQAKEERIEAQRRAIQAQLEVERKAQEARLEADRSRAEADRRAREAKFDADLKVLAEAANSPEARAREERIEAMRRAMESQLKRERDAAEADRQKLAAAKAEQEKKDPASMVQLEITGPLVSRFGARTIVRVLVPCVLHNGADQKIKRVGFSLVFSKPGALGEGKEYKQADLVFSNYGDGFPAPGQRVQCNINQPNVPDDADRLECKVVINSVDFDAP